MSYVSMETRAKLLEDILKQALSELGECHPWCCGSAATLTNHDPASGTYEIQDSPGPCDCWMVRAKNALSVPLPPIQYADCGCGHDSGTHAGGGSGLCCAEGCPCMAYKKGKADQ